MSWKQEQVANKQIVCITVSSDNNIALYINCGPKG